MINRIVLITLFVGTKVPYTTIFLQPYFESVSRAYEEAASIDGGHPVRAFWQIVFPMVRGGLITVTIFNFINIWNEYFLSLLLVNSEKLRPVALGLFSMINGMQVSGGWSGLFASVMIIFAPTFLIYIFLSKYIIGGLTGGAPAGYRRPNPWLRIQARGRGSPPAHPNATFQYRPSGTPLSPGPGQC